MRKHIPTLLFLVFILLSRLPFLGEGFGAEEDSWGLALSSYHTHETHVFEVSRMPGHPVQEIILSLLWGSGAYVFNLLSAIFSVIAAFYLLKIFEELKIPNPYWAATAFAFAPIIYISSTYTIDYMWGIALFLAGLFYLFRGKYIWAGVFLGLAISCRLTYAAVLLPYAYFLYDEKQIRISIISFLKITFVALITTLLCYIPIFIQYGFSILEYWDLFAPSLLKLVYKASLGVFGLMGTIAVVYGFFLFLITVRKNKELVKGKAKHFILFCSFILLVFILLYLKLPQKSGYLIPIVPMLLILFALILTEQQFIFICLCLIISSFTGSVNLTNKYRGASYSENAVKTTISGQEIFFDMFTGPIQSDQSKRTQKNNFVSKVIDNTKNLNTDMLIISGWWYNQIMVESLTQKINKKARFIDYANADTLRKYRHNNFMIFYLPEQEKNNDLIHGIKTEEYAYPFILN